VVGDWVAQHAGEALQDRRRRVEAVERASVDLGHVGPGVAAAATAELVGPSSSRPFVAAEPADLGASGSATSRTSNLMVTSSAAANAATTLRQIMIALLFGAVGVAVIGGIWFWQQRALDDAKGAHPSAVLPELPSNSSAAASRSTSRSGPLAVDDGTPPPVVETDSAPVSTDSPDGGKPGHVAPCAESGK